MVEQFDDAGRPVRVKVGPVDYTVLWVDIATWRAMGTPGQQDPICQTIRLLADHPAGGIAVDFVHELMHAFRYQSPICGVGDINEEMACQLAATNLTAFWRDNPLTFAWWASLLALTPPCDGQ
jgi:hypothetical protein